MNLQLNATVGSNNLTIAIKGNNGSDPSATNPVLIPFRHSTIANGSPQFVSLQSALSFQINSGSTMGCVSGQMCRLWVLAICSTGLECTGSAGSDVVGLCAFNALSGANVAPINEAALQTSASGTNGGNSAQTYYCNISGVTARAIRIIGYVEIQEGSAGTWASGPTYTQLFGPGIKKPGDTVQSLSATFTASTTSSGITPTQTGTTLSISPTSAANPILVQANGNFEALSNPIVAQLSRGAGPTFIGNLAAYLPVAASFPITPASLMAVDIPNTTSSTAYCVYVNGITSGNAIWNPPVTGQTPTTSMRLKEIMGFLEPANDDQPLSMVG